MPTDDSSSGFNGLGDGVGVTSVHLYDMYGVSKRFESICLFRRATGCKDDIRGLSDELLHKSKADASIRPIRFQSEIDEDGTGKRNLTL